MNTSPTHISGELTNMFDVSHAGAGLSLEEITHNYYVAAKMGGNDDASTGGLRINKSGRSDDMHISGDKEKKATRDLMLLTMLNDIEAMEANLADKHGEGFAENLAAEHLNEETYMRLMSIEDQDERRRQIAIELKKGIDDGSIDPNAIDSPDLKEWIETRAELEQQEVKLAEAKMEFAEQPSSEQTHTIAENSNLSSGLNNILG